MQLVAMDGLWRFHTGDNAAWSEPGFDDSQWPLAAAMTPWIIPHPAPATMTGWYRLHIILPGSAEPLSLLLPPLPTSYQIFANGRELGHFGSPVGLVKNPVSRLFQIPSDINRSRSLVISVRVQYQPHLAFYAGPPGFHGIPLLGTASQTAAHLHRERMAAMHSNISSFVVVFLCLQVAVVSAFASLLYRSDREYMWVAVYALASAVFFGLAATLPLFDWPVVPAGLFLGGLNVVFAISEFQIVANLLKPAMHTRAEPMAEANRQISRGYLYSPWGLTMVAAVLIGGVGELLVVDGRRSGLWNELHALLFLAIPISMLWLIRTSARKERLRAWILFTAFTCVVGYFNILCLFRKLPFVSRPVKDFLTRSYRSLILSPFPIGFWELSEILIMIALLVVVVERFIQAQRKEQRLESKIEAARLV